MADPVIPQTLANLYAAFAPDAMAEGTRNPRRELIGTMFYLYQQAVDASAAAAATAAAVEATLNNSAVGKALGVASRPDGFSNFTAKRMVKFSAVTTSGGYYWFEFTFSTPMPNTDYGVLYNFGTSAVPTITKNVGSVRFSFSNASNFISILNVAVFIL